MGSPSFTTVPYMVWIKTDQIGSVVLCLIPLSCSPTAYMNQGIARQLLFQKVHRMTSLCSAGNMHPLDTVETLNFLPKSLIFHSPVPVFQQEVSVLLHDCESQALPDLQYTGGQRYVCLARVSVP